MFVPLKKKQRYNRYDAGAIKLSVKIGVITLIRLISAIIFFSYNYQSAKLILKTVMMYSHHAKCETFFILSVVHFARTK